MAEDTFFERETPTCPICREGRVVVNTGVRDPTTRDLIYQCDSNSDHQFTRAEYFRYSPTPIPPKETRGPEIVPPYPPSRETIRRIEEGRKRAEEAEKSALRFRERMELERAKEWETLREKWERLPRETKGKGKISPLIPTPKEPFVPIFRRLPFFKRKPLPVPPKVEEGKQLSFEDEERMRAIIGDVNKELEKTSTELMFNLKKRYEYLIVKIDQIVRLGPSITDKQVRKSINDSLTKLYGLLQQFNNDLSDRQYKEAQDMLVEAESIISTIVKLFSERRSEIFKSGSVLRTMEETAKMRIADEQAQSGDWSLEDFEKSEKAQKEKEISEEYETQAREGISEVAWEIADLGTEVEKIGNFIRGGLTAEQSRGLLGEVTQLLKRLDDIEKSG